MNGLLIVQLLGWLLVALGALQLLPIATALVYGERILPYVASALGALAVGLPVALSTRGGPLELRARDGFVVVSLSWILASIFGGLPYITTGTLGLVDALFETAAGFSTTGSSVIPDVESLPHALLMWRAFTQWLGGMGIIVLTIAILPLLGVGGMQLFRAEVPGVTADKLTPRVGATARRLWFIYLGFTLVSFSALVLAGLSPFEALCHAFSNISTGGFSTRNASVAAFDSALVEWIVIAFMLIGSLNFVIHYRILMGRGRSILGDAELRYFLGLVTIASVVILLARLGADSAAPAPVRSTVFQVLSLVSTTGYATADYETWPMLAQLVLVQMMILGGMTGSTAGGVKSLRALLGLRVLRTAFQRLAHPHAVRPVKYAGRTVSVDVLASVWAFLTAYFVLAVLAAAVMAADGYDLLTSITAALTALGNVGPAFGALGPTETFAPLPASAKLALSFCMIAGRLEIFTLLLLLQPRFWSR